MNFNWTEYLQLAKMLAGKAVDPPPSEEAKLRSAISRSYYAVHRKASLFLCSFDGLTLPEDGTVHLLVIGKFKNSAFTDRKDVGVKLDRLRIYRRSADYQDSFDELNRACEISIQFASKAISRIDTLASS